MKNRGRIDFLRAAFICLALLSSFSAIDCNRAEELSSEVQISNVESSTVDAISREAGASGIESPTEESASTSDEESEAASSAKVEIVASSDDSSTVDASSREVGARKVLTINGVEVAFRWCPAGIFTMGSPEDEKGHGRGEMQHEVILTQGFWLAETETTQALWKAVMGRNPSYFKGDDLHPVECVSWKDCQKFIQKLNGSKVSGVGKFRLPTEAEWEYACRAGTTTAFPWGNVLNGDKANCGGNYPYGTETKGKYLEKTTRVGSYESNAWGLYDMIGNVWEWCQDWYDDYPSGTETDPQGAASGTSRVLRGGSWAVGSRFCRSAFRSCEDPAISFSQSFGFRLAMTGESALFESSRKTEESASTSDEESEAASSAKVEIVASSDDSSTVDASSREVGARKVLTINGVEVAFRWAPAGRFIMGSPQSEAGRRVNDVNETQHVVVLTQGFWLAETETTQALWKAVMGRNPSLFTGDDLLPVENVTWNDCQAFIHKLNVGIKGSGVGVFRLPTEAEWEYACRAGTTSAFPWGNVLNGDKANCYGNYPYGTEEKGKYLKKTTRVGSYEANAWGLYDMNGNVWEWCQDWYGAYPSGTQTDPQGASRGSNRVLRGGSWHYDPRFCRSACRFYCAPARRSSDFGFRVAMTGESALFESSSK